MSIAKFAKLPAPDKPDNAIKAVYDRSFGKLVALTDELDLRTLYACIATYWYNADQDDEAYWHSISVPRPKGYSLSIAQRGIKVMVQNHLTSQQAGQSHHAAESAATPLPAIQPASPTRTRKRRPVELSIDAVLLKQVSQQYGIPIRHSPDAQAQAVETLLSQLQQGLLAPSQPTTPAPEPMPDRTTTWFDGRIDALEQQVEQFQAERDQAVEEHAQLEQDLAEAQTRIDQLQSRLQQLEQAQVALDHLQKLLPQLAHPQAKSAQTEARTQLPITSVALTEAAAILTPERNTRSAPVEAASTASATAARRPSQGDKRNLVDTEAKIAYILDRIFAFNSACDQPNQRWQISFPPVRELAKALGADNQGAIKNLFDQQKEAIQHHHFDCGIISSRHNHQHNHPITDGYCQLNLLCSRLSTIISQSSSLLNLRRRF